MKMVHTIVNKADARGLAEALRERGYSSTCVGATGGFLGKGNSTFLVGVDEKEVEAVLSLINENFKKRTQRMNLMPEGELSKGQLVDVEVGGAVVFVLDAERFGKF